MVFMRLFGPGRVVDAVTGDDAFHDEWNRGGSPSSRRIAEQKNRESFEGTDRTSGRPRLVCDCARYRVDPTIGSKVARSVGNRRSDRAAARTINPAHPTTASMINATPAR